MECVQHKSHKSHKSHPLKYMYTPWTLVHSIKINTPPHTTSSVALATSRSQVAVRAVKSRTTQHINVHVSGWQWQWQLCTQHHTHAMLAAWPHWPQQKHGHHPESAGLPLLPSLHLVTPTCSLQHSASRRVPAPALSFSPVHHEHHIPGSWMVVLACAAWKHQ